jgi:hypothetical protein
MAKEPETQADEAPALYVVLEPFMAEGFDLYAEGQVIHPDDPHIKLMPSRFGPFAFPHPVKRHGFAEKMAEAKAAKAFGITTPEVRAG